MLDVEVEVLVDGTWWPGWLDPDHWRRTPEGRWEGFVRWSKGPADDFLRHFVEADIRRV